MLKVAKKKGGDNLSSITFPAAVTYYPPLVHVLNIADLAQNYLSHAAAF